MPREKQNQPRKRPGARAFISSLNTFAQTALLAARPFEHLLQTGKTFALCATRTAPDSAWQHQLFVFDYGLIQVVQPIILCTVVHCRFDAFAVNEPEPPLDQYDDCHV